jgi:hypothetical protein
VRSRAGLQAQIRRDGLFFARLACFDHNRQRRDLMNRSILIIIICLVLAASVPPHAGAGDDRICAECGRPITGAYFETGSHFYHPNCFTCAHCGAPIKDAYLVYKNKNYHRRCFEDHVALRCAVCGGVIGGEYLIDYWGNAYHKSHQGVVLQCDFCQRFIHGELLDGMVRLPDDRRLCGKCAPSAITRTGEVRLILAEVSEVLETFGMTVDISRIELELVGIDELKRIASSRSHNTKGFSDYTVQKNVFGKVKSETIKVYLLNGMPRTQMVSTCAHELAHVWQFQNGRLDQDPAVSEGSCNFAAYLVLRKLGGEYTNFVIDNMLKDPDPVYGGGFRRVKRYAEREGIGTWLKSLKKKNPDLS